MEEQLADILASSCACASLTVDSVDLKQATSMTTDDYINDEGNFKQTAMGLADRNNETESALTADFEQATARTAINCNDDMELRQRVDGIQDEKLSDQKNDDNDDSDASTIIEEYSDLFLGQNDINNMPCSEVLCDVVQVSSSGSASKNFVHELESINAAGNIKSSKSTKRPRGRPRKIPAESHVNGSHNARSLQNNFSFRPETTGNRDSEFLWS